MDLNLQDKVIIVTGGTRGIGGAISRSLSLEGAIPVFVGRNKEGGEILERELNSKNQKGIYIEGDLNKEGECRGIVEEVINKLGKIDALVNNAGVNDNVGLESGTPEEFKISLFNNVNHYYEMTHYCLPFLKTTKGNILNISSKVALSGQGGTSGYAAAKGAQLALTREWAAELLSYGIRVNAILPAEVMTPLYKSWLDSFEDPAEKRKKIETKIPLGNRMTTDMEIAATALFIISSRSSHTTAQFIIPDGGYIHLDRSLT